MEPEAKVVLVTGSSSGIGAATAKLFARRGLRVAVTGSNQSRVDWVAQECTQLSPQGHKAFPIVADLNNPENGHFIVRQTVDHFKRLDVLVNNAGVYFRTHAADKNSLEAYAKTMAINCDSVVRTSMEAIEHLERTAGNIVFVSSVASVKPVASGYAYRMSKAALTSYAKCLAIDVAPRVRVNIVSPGPVATPMLERGVKLSGEALRAKYAPTNLLGRIGECDEIAATIFYLASDEASFVNGTELFVDGGYLCKPQTSS